MFAMFRQFFVMFQSLFAAGEKAANSLNNLAEVGESMSRQYLVEQQHALQQKIMRLERETADVKKITSAK